MIFQKHIQINGTLFCKTGLHIGGSTGQIGIGDIDLSVIKHPLSGEPYIPGSSLKGKIRSLLEAGQKNYQWKGRGYDRKKVESITDPCGCGECLICRVFGPHKNSEHTLGPTRLLVRDALLNQESRQQFTEAQEKGLIFFEEKTENIINRSTRVAEHPRTQERVPSGTMFDFYLTLRVFDADDLDAKILPLLAKGLQLLEADYLGGSGSRGYGQVEIRELKKDGKPWELA